MKEVIILFYETYISKGIPLMKTEFDWEKFEQCKVELT